MGSLKAKFQPTQKIKNFRKWHFKNFTVLYHVKIWWSGSTRLNLVFWYVVRNMHSYHNAKNQAISRNFPEFIAKKLSRGHPRYVHFEIFGRVILKMFTRVSISIRGQYWTAISMLNSHKDFWWAKYQMVLVFFGLW